MPSDKSTKPRKPHPPKSIWTEEYKKEYRRQYYLKKHGKRKPRSVPSIWTEEYKKEYRQQYYLKKHGKRKPRPTVSIWTDEYRKEYNRKASKRRYLANKEFHQKWRENNSVPNKYTRPKIWRNEYIEQTDDTVKMMIYKNKHLEAEVIIDKSALLDIKKYAWRWKEKRVIKSVPGGEMCLRTMIIGHPPEGHGVEHINGCTTDYRACNLRHFCRAKRHEEQKIKDRIEHPLINRPKNTGSVSFHKLSRRWEARFPQPSRKVLGYFMTKEEAETALAMALGL